MKKIILRKKYGNELEGLVLFLSQIQLFIGVLFLIPPILGVILFTLNVFGLDGYIDSLDYLSVNWTGGDGAMSAAPIYLGLMALAGAFMVHSAIKNSFFAANNSAELINEIDIVDKKE